MSLTEMSLTNMFLMGVGGSLALFVIFMFRHYVWLVVAPPVIGFFVYLIVHTFRLHP